MVEKRFARSCLVSAGRWDDTGEHCDLWARADGFGGASTLTEIAKRVCNRLCPTPLIPAHRTKVSATLLFDPAAKGDLHPSFLLLSTVMVCHTLVSIEPSNVSSYRDVKSSTLQ
jgi:hypothetical protein